MNVILCAGLIAAAVALPSGCGSLLQVRDLQPGDSVSIRSGLTLVVPEGASATYTRWREVSDEAGGALQEADQLVIGGASSESQGGVDLLAYWPSPEGEQSAVDMIERQRLVSASPDDTVGVWWSGHRENAFVWVVTRIPGRLTGIVSIYRSKAESPQQAWQEASAAWQNLSVSGAELPAPPP